MTCNSATLCCNILEKEKGTIDEMNNKLWEDEKAIHRIWKDRYWIEGCCAYSQRWCVGMKRLNWGSAIIYVRVVVYFMAWSVRKDGGGKLSGYGRGRLRIARI